MDNVIVGGCVTHHRFEILLSTSGWSEWSRTQSLDARDLALVRTVSFQFYRSGRNLELLVYRDVLINRQLISMYMHECCGSIVARESGDNVMFRECDLLSRKRNYSRIIIEFESIGFNNSFRIIDENSMM